MGDIKTVFCPVINGQIDGVGCLEIVLVTDNEMKESTLPENIEWNEEQRQKCLKCPYHDDLED